MIEPTRQIYWNVGHGAVLPMYLLAGAAAAACAFGFWRRVRVYRLARPLDRLDGLASRVAGMLRAALGQGGVLRERGPGIPHALFFWSSLVLLAGTVLVMVQADFTEPVLGRPFLRGRFYLGYSLALDLAGLVAIVTLAGLAARRLALRRADGLGAHALLLAILVTGFAVEGARVAATELPGSPELARFSPVGLLAAGAFAGMGGAALRGAHRALWWLHLVLVLGAVAALPFTKLRHLVTTPLGRLFADRRPRGSLARLDLESEGPFGAAKVADLTWKDVFDADACTGCERCERRCPAHATGKPLSPLRLVRQIGNAAFLDPGVNVVDAAWRDAIWSCTTCFACQDACPASVEHVGKVIEMRRHLALMEGEFPGDEVRAAEGHVEVSGNPFGFAPASRGDWARGLDVPVLGDGGAKADVLYFAGCYASFDRRNREVARSFVRVCRAAGVRVGILGKSEWCCGEPVRHLGNEYLYQEAARRVADAIHASGARKVVTTCAHCLNALSRDYSDLGFALEVEHHTTFIEWLVASGRLPLRADALDCTYHDSCQLARVRGITDAPRAVLRAAGARVTEMARSGRDGFCCGGGGGRVLAEEKLGSRINVARARMARETGAPVLVSSCPFCLTMLEDGVKAGGHEGRLVARDLAEVVAERIGGST